MAQPLCELCIATCPRPQCACERCGLSMRHGRLNVCKTCEESPPVFDRCMAPFAYEFPVNRLIHGIKYGNRLELFKPLAKLLVTRLQEAYAEQQWPQVVLPIPLHNKRLRERGYDQTLLLAKALGLQQVPVDAKLLVRAQHSDPQQSLTAPQRRCNIKNAYQLSRCVNYQHVAILDDVVTSGATANEVAALLKKAGVSRVDVWCLARTPMP